MNTVELKSNVDKINVSVSIVYHNVTHICDGCSYASWYTVIMTIKYTEWQAARVYLVARSKYHKYVVSGCGLRPHMCDVGVLWKSNVESVANVLNG